MDNLLARFSDLHDELVRDVLQQQKGHAGRAARCLRELSEAATRSKLRRDEPRQHERPARAMAAAQRRHTRMGENKTNISARTPAASAGKRRRLNARKPLALQRVGGNGDTRVLVRVVRELYRWAGTLTWAFRNSLF